MLYIVSVLPEHAHCQLTGKMSSHACMKADDLTRYRVMHAHWTQGRTKGWMPCAVLCGGLLSWKLQRTELNVTEGELGKRGQRSPALAAYPGSVVERTLLTYWLAQKSPGSSSVYSGLVSFLKMTVKSC